MEAVKQYLIALRDIEEKFKEIEARGQTNLSQCVDQIADATALLCEFIRSSSVVDIHHGSALKIVVGSYAEAIEDTLDNMEEILAHIEQGDKL